MDRKALDNLCEKGILLLILSALIFSALATGAVRTMEFAIVQGLTAAAAILWILRIWVYPKRKRLLFPPVAWAALSFLVYGIYHYINADVEYTARQEMLRLVVYILIFLVVMNNLLKSDYVQLILYALVFTGTLISIYGLIQVITGSEHVWHFIRPAQYSGRGSGTFINPNHFAGFLGMLFPLSLAALLTGRISMPMRILLGYSALMLLFGIAFSMSRGGWISTTLMLITLIVILGWQKQFRLRSIGLVSIILVIIGLFFIKSDFAQDRIGRLSTQGTQEHIGSRKELWNAAVNVWKEEKLIGVGPGHFDHRFPSHRPKTIQSSPVRVHNDYLNLLVDWGGIGLLLAGVWLGTFIFTIIRSWKYSQRTASDFSTKTSNRAAFVLGSTIGLGSLALHSFVDFNLHIPSNAMLASTLAALLTSFIRFATERYWIPLKIPLKIGLSLFVCVFAGILFHQTIGQVRELGALKASQQATSFSEQLIKLELAIKREPKNHNTAASIGEIYRIKANEIATTDAINQATKWFRRAIELNPYDAYSHARLGITLDKLDQGTEAKKMFKIAETLDPNGYMIIAYIAWHKMHIGDFVSAKRYFERVSPPDKPESGLIAWRSETSATNLVNQIRAVYLPYINEKLKNLDNSK
ncbi:MAG: O-antigen ligase family protein [Verrucomicrobiota bacterium]|nr:O-antigen ligase family protein [Verrucomicrobiota bacterium]